MSFSNGVPKYLGPLKARLIWMSSKENQITLSTTVLCERFLRTLVIILRKNFLTIKKVLKSQDIPSRQQLFKVFKLGWFWLPCAAGAPAFKLIDRLPLLSLAQSLLTLHSPPLPSSTPTHSVILAATHSCGYLATTKIADINLTLIGRKRQKFKSKTSLRGLNFCPPRDRKTLYTIGCNSNLRDKRGETKIKIEFAVH